MWQKSCKKRLSPRVWSKISEACNLAATVNPTKLKAGTAEGSLCSKIQLHPYSHSDTDHDCDKRSNTGTGKLQHVGCTQPSRSCLAPQYVWFQAFLNKDYSLIKQRHNIMLNETTMRCGSHSVMMWPIETTHMFPVVFGGKNCHSIYQYCIIYYTTCSKKTYL